METEEAPDSAGGGKPSSKDTAVMVQAQTPPFGNLLRRYRQAAVLTQEELAERAGLSVRGIKALEGGERTRPHRDTVRLLAKALDLNSKDRSSFEAAARAPLPLDAPPAVRSAEPIGDFLGARPAGPLVAREEEWGDLLLVLDVVGSGGGRLVLLPGEEGVGKTRLVQEVDLQARDRGYLVTTGRCYRSDNVRPFAVFSDVVTAISTQLSPQRWSDLVARWPEVEWLVPDGSVSAEGIEADERRIARALASVLGAVAEERPMALLLDDLQWADRRSITLFQYLARFTRSQPVLLVGTYRPSEVDRESVLGLALRDLMGEGLVERIPIRALTLEGTAALVEACIGALDGAEEFVEFVHRRSKGVPFYIKRMVLALGGRYRLVRQIGAGGMGRVFEAVDTESDETVATKIMLARTESDVHARLRFEQEGTVLAALDHPNIVRVFGTFLEEHASCIVMELIEGQSLGQIVTAQRKIRGDGHPEDPGDGNPGLPLERVQRLAVQVLDALACAHERGVAHRDIKPDNIMVQPGDRVKVTDFGIARLLRPIDALTTMTSTGMTMGTPLYMAPEQIRDERVDGRADLYAVGTVLYELLTGRPPFEGHDPLALAVKHLQQAPVPPSVVNPNLPAEWDGVVLKALAKDPTQRFQSALEMREAVAALPTDVAPVRKSGGPEVAPPQSRGVRRRRIALAAVTAFLGLAAIAGAYHFFSPQGHDSPQSPAVASLGEPKPWGWAMDTRGELAAPAAVTVDRFGNVYVANEGNNTIDKFSDNGTFLARFGAGGSGTAHFDSPSSVAVDPQGHLFVLNTGNHKVQELSPSGNVLSTMSSPTVSAIHVGFVAVDPVGTVYLFDPSSGGGIVAYAPGPNGIVSWTAGSSASYGFSGSGVSLGGAGGTHSALPSGFGVDGHGDVYVADSRTGYITKFLAHGGPLRQWRLGVLAEAAGGSEGLAVDGSGRVYVADSKNNRILKLSPDGHVLMIWQSSSRTRFLHPSSVAIDRAGNVYVTNEGNNVTQKLSSHGRLLREWGRSPRRSAGLRDPQSTAVDGHGDVLVVTGSASDHLQEFAPSGRQIADWGPTFGRPGTRRSLGSLGVDGQGHIYVTDVVQNHLLKLSARGRLLAEWAPPVTAIAGVATDLHGNVYVGDSGNGRVLKLSAAGRVVSRWETGAFTTPQHLAVDGQGNVYVVYAGENLVQTFSPAGTLVHEWGGSGRGELTDTADVAVGRQGTVYVVDDAAAHVVGFSPRGAVRGVWGSAGSQPGQFSNPSAVAVDGTGNVYVADTGNHRIQRLAPRLRG